MGSSLVATPARYPFLIGFAIFREIAGFVTFRICGVEGLSSFFLFVFFVLMGSVSKAQEVVY